MIKKAKKERVKVLLAEAVRLLCQKELDACYTKDLIIQGLLGITLDDEDIFLIDMNETVTGELWEENPSGEEVSSH